MKNKKKMTGKQILWVILVILGILVVIVIVIITPWNYSNLASHPNPVQSYDEAVQRINALRAQETAGMNPVCTPQFMTHEKKVERAIVIVHGYGNCPQQFHELGQRFYDLGYNVLIAPLPHHGLADRMTEDHAKLTAEELATYSDQTADILQGLGDHRTMLGISMGGIVTAWTAQNRADLDQALILSPMFGFHQIPTAFTAAAMNVYLTLPDAFVWWDPGKLVDTPPSYGYPRYSKHALVQALRLGFATQASLKSMPSAAKKLVVVLNANDTAVNNELTMEMVKIWQAHNANISTYVFDAKLKLGHDMIDPSQSDQKIDIVYPKLIELASQ